MFHRVLVAAAILGLGFEAQAADRQPVKDTDSDAVTFTLSQRPADNADLAGFGERIADALSGQGFRQVASDGDLSVTIHPIATGTENQGRAINPKQGQTAPATRPVYSHHILPQTRRSAGDSDTGRLTVTVRDTRDGSVLFDGTVASSADRASGLMAALVEAVTAGSREEARTVGHKQGQRMTFPL